MDVLAVRAAALRAIARARAGEGPSFLVCATWRYGGHHVGDKQEYKDAAEAQAWRAKDPIERLLRYLAETGGATAAEIGAMGEEIEAAIRTALGQAKAAPLPQPADLGTHLHA
jgi:pyruvate dehydrogenase E1 component alpha subunit